MARLTSLEALRLISTGIVEVASRGRSSRQSSPSLYPYPEPLQAGLNHLVWLGIANGGESPATVPELIEWASSRPVEAWPLTLPEGTVGADDLLLEDGEPTLTCLEIALPTGGPAAEADFSERSFLHRLLDLSQEHGNPAMYRRVRSLLITKPVLDAFTRQELQHDPELGPCWPLLEEAYPEAPLETLVDGCRHLCRGCGNLLVRTRARGLHCQDPRCGQRLARYPLAEVVPSGEHQHYWLRYDLRMFVASPGRSELALARRLERLPTSVELYPAFDAFDILVTFKSGERWAIDIKDWSNPYRLATALGRFASAPTWDRAFVVIPASRVRALPSYLHTVRSYAAAEVFQEAVAVVTDDALLRRARRTGGAAR